MTSFGEERLSTSMSRAEQSGKMGMEKRGCNEERKPRGWLERVVDVPNG
jgi:hypothetical protein